MRRLNYILFRSSSDLVHVAQTIQPAIATHIRPVKSYEFYSGRHHLISMAIQSGVNEHVSCTCQYPAVVS